MADRFYLPRAFSVDTNGTPRAGAKLYFYASGTTTPQDTYSDSDGAVPNANPVVADANGLFGPIFLGSGDYKVVLKDADDVTISTDDPVSAIGSVSAASQAETDAGTSTSTYVSPARIAEGADKQGSSIASAATLTLPDVGNYFTVTGSTTIAAISTRSAGRVIRLRFSGSLTLTTSATLILGGGDLSVTAGDVIALVSEGSGTWRLIGMSMPRGYLAGLTLSNNGTDANNDIDIAVGECRDSTDAYDLRLTSALTKRLDAAWAVGTNAGGLDTGSKANSTWYHVWLIARSDTGVVDALFSTSATSPTMPTNYDYKRRIGAVATDGSGNIRAFLQFGDEFWWKTPPLDVSASIGATRVNYTMTVPDGISVIAMCNVNYYNSGGTGGVVYFAHPDSTDSAPSNTAAPLGQAGSQAAASGDGSQIYVRTNASRQIAARSNYASNNSLYVATLGWVESRGRDD